MHGGIYFKLFVLDWFKTYIFIFYFHIFNFFAVNCDKFCINQAESVVRVVVIRRFMAVVL